MKVDIAPVLRGIAITVVGTGLLGAGSTLIKTADAVSVLQSQRNDDTQRLERIESKVDKLLEKANGPSH